MDLPDQGQIHFMSLEAGLIRTGAITAGNRDVQETKINAQLCAMMNDLAIAMPNVFQFRICAMNGVSTPHRPGFMGQFIICGCC